MTFNFKGMVIILAAAISAGCAQTPSKPEPVDQVPTATTESSNPTAQLDTTADQSSFESSTLYSLLVAELAGQRGLPKVTLHNYIQEARKTGDLGIIKRAAEIAEELQDEESLLEIALLWTEAEPENSVPFSIASKELVRQGRYNEAQPILKRSLELNRVGVIDTLASYGKTMKTEERQAYLTFFDELLQESPENPYYLYAKASLLTHEGRLEEALALSQKALQSEPKYDRAILLEADLQAKLGHLDTAIGHLREHLSWVDRKKYRNHKQFRILYTRLLLEKNQFAEAKAQADIVALKNRHDENVLFYLGVLMLEYELLDTSERYLSLVADLAGFNGALRYYHGRIAQLRGHYQQAIDYYVNVDDTRYIVSSFNEISNILDKPENQPQIADIFSTARNKYPNYSPILYSVESNWLLSKKLHKSALRLLNEGLEQYPKDVRLLYSRGMLWEEFDDLLKMETDLRVLLDIQPRNASALNALGYTLTDRTQRHTEAEKLIRQALAIKPEDPAVLDSMGWVLHNLGKYDNALKYLIQAYNIFPDPEIAAHLGTVYWKMGQREKALKVWDNALKEHPEHPLLIESRAIADEQI